VPPFMIVEGTVKERGTIKVTKFNINIEEVVKILAISLNCEVTFI